MPSSSSSFSNPTLKISDISAIADIAHSHEGIEVIVDSTFASPYLQNPLDLGADIAVKQMHNGFGGMMSVDIHGGLDAVRTVMNNVKVFSLATSLGNVDSLIQHSPSMSHFDMTPEERHAVSIFDGQVRLSIGIEDADDLIEDLDHALSLI